MKIGEEFICYQHHQAESILEKLLKDNFISVTLCDRARKDIKEAIEWIHKANDSAVRMENKLKEYKENDRTRS